MHILVLVLIHIQTLILILIHIHVHILIPIHVLIPTLVQMMRHAPSSRPSSDVPSIEAHMSVWDNRRRHSSAARLSPSEVCLGPCAFLSHIHIRMTLYSYICNTNTHTHNLLITIFIYIHLVSRT
jgi:hypothetical protein